mmetsp:Transcript_21971/g.19527  ORF Transcript_21971/g.19527 Transcript_21971/m.19527 type:complete len:170 (+) Transcript_21971:85-594(+)
MGLFATCSKDGTANLYRTSPAYIIRSFKQPDGNPLKRVFISESPLACLIMLSHNLKDLTSFSINGRFLASYEDFRNIENPIIVTDSNFNDKLVYGNTTGKLVFTKLPYFDDIEIKPCLYKQTVTPLAVTPDKRMLLFFQDGLWCIGDFVTNIKKEPKEFKNIMGFIKRV